MGTPTWKSISEKIQDLEAVWQRRKDVGSASDTGAPQATGSGGQSDKSARDEASRGRGSGGNLDSVGGKVTACVGKSFITQVNVLF